MADLEGVWGVAPPPPGWNPFFSSFFGAELDPPLRSSVLKTLLTRGRHGVTHWPTDPDYDQVINTMMALVLLGADHVWWQKIRAKLGPKTTICQAWMHAGVHAWVPNMWHWHASLVMHDQDSHQKQTLSCHQNHANKMSRLCLIRTDSRMPFWHGTTSTDTCQFRDGHHI